MVRVQHTLSPTAPLEDAAYYSLSLREGVLQCLEAAHLEGQHPSVLEDWLGPLEEFEEYATNADMEVVFTVRRFFPEALQVRCPTVLNIQFVLMSAVPR